MTGVWKTNDTGHGNSSKHSFAVTRPRIPKELQDRFEALSKSKVSCDFIRHITEFPKRRIEMMLDRWIAANFLLQPANRSTLFPDHIGEFRPMLFPQANRYSNNRLTPHLLGNFSKDFENENPEIFQNIWFSRQIEVSNTSQVIQLNQICNGNADCKNSYDELFCPGKFYCDNGKPLYISKSQEMDGKADCSDKSDELNLKRPRKHVLSSEYNLIGSWILQILVWIIALFALVGNSLVIICTVFELIGIKKGVSAFSLLKRFSKSKYPKNSCKSDVFRMKPSVNCRTRLVKVWNSVLVLNLATADLLMGIYLTWLGVLSAFYDGASNPESQYWMMDHHWRSSNTCSFLGVLLVISSQTSVNTLIALTSLRLYTVIKPFKTYKLKIRYLVLACLMAWVISLVLALFPIFPAFKDNFTKSALVPFFQFQPPNINRTEAEQLIHKIAFISNSSLSEYQPLTWHTIQQFVKKSIPEYSKWRFYGYYSEDSVCMPKLFVNPKFDLFWKYTTSIISFNFVAFIYIAVTYAVLYLKSKSSSKKTKPSQSCKLTKSNTGTQNLKHSTNQTTVCSVKRSSSYRNCQKAYGPKELKKGSKINHEIQRRIALLIATDCICWVPICVMGFFSVAGYFIPDTAYAITAVVLLPINSALNPLLYSRILHMFWERAWFKLKTNNMVVDEPAEANKTKQ